MKVSLISHTPDPDKICAYAAHVCYQKGDFNPEKETEKLLKIIKKNGHMSVLEHASFTFYIEDVSRVCTHQLVRHRLASYSQQSFRHTKPDSFFLPKSINNKKYNEMIEKMFDNYNKMIADGISEEDARYLLPNAITSSIVVTMNARELYLFFSERCCMRAQFEIREVANKMLGLVKPVAPMIFSDAGPICIRGSCPEVSFKCPKKKNE